MSKSVKFTVLAGLVALAAACAREPEPVVIETPVAPEPAYNKF